jgi:cellulose synthase/poly-beta-1,6-N-acetylglucosamine synthase-like glycosyltransferase
MAEHYGKEIAHLYIIDDSDDETRNEIDDLVSSLSLQGFHIDVIRRVMRTGFKAGALQAALELTKEDFIAIFDADFSPPMDFLDKAVPQLLQDERTGFVQCRWGHFDRNYNMITETLAIGIDAHFLLEQAGRWSSDYIMNFNGSAGLLRKEAIIGAGGWHSDTLAEDLDLSYRMHLAGYRAIYLKDVEVQAELPPTILSLKRQQGRWAQGSLQTARKLIPSILGSSSLSKIQKFEAIVHLTYYLVHPLMMGSFLLALVATFLNIDVIKYAVDVSIPTIHASDIKNLTFQTLAFSTIQVAPWLIFSLLIIVSTLAVLFYSIEAVRAQRLGLLSNIKHIFLLMILGYGISISNSLRALSGLLGHGGSFLRTPKYAITNMTNTWEGKKYQLRWDRTTLLEGVAVLISILAILRAVLTNNVGIIPILMIYAAGYLLVFMLTLFQQ